MEQVEIYLVVDLPENFINDWSGLRDGVYPEIKKGWKTWVAPKYVKDIGTRGTGGNIHPEGNRYLINFPGRFFDFSMPWEPSLDDFFKVV